MWWIAEDHPDIPATVESPSGRALTYRELTDRAHDLIIRSVSSMLSYAGMSNDHIVGAPISIRRAVGIQGNSTEN